MASLAMLSLMSCQNDTLREADQGTGYLYVSLDRDDSEDLVFKSVQEADIPFSLKVSNELGQEVASVEDHRTLAETPLALKVGKYTVTASSADAPETAMFDAPFYSGSAEFEVRADQVTNIDVTCSLANVKVTAVFSEDIRKNFEIYELTVSNGSASLVFSNENGTSGKAGYFSPTGTLTWSLYLKNLDGLKSVMAGKYDSVKPRQHYNLSFSLEEKNDNGAGGFYIVLDDSMTEKKYDLVLDFGNKDVPEMSADFEIPDNGPVTLNAGDNTSKVLTFTSKNGFRNLLLSYGFKASAMSAGRASAAQVDLVGASSAEIAALEVAGIRTASVQEGDASAVVDITEYIADCPIGSATVSVTAVDTKGVFKETVIDFELMSPVGVDAVSANAWAMFATLKGKWFAASQPAGIAFQYRKASDAAWTDVTDVVTQTGSRTYTADITGLEPETEYVFRAVSDEDRETREISFTTEVAGTLHNMSFDNWYQNGKAWMPNLSASYKVWDSANPGSSGFSIVPTTPTDDVAVSGQGKKAAKLESKKALIVLAAGNIYTGKFIATSGLGASLDWGVPFTSRPLALKGWYKYQPKAIDMVKSPYENLKGQTDICQIQILLTDWEKPFTVDTNTGTFVDFENDPHIIAYGKFETSASSSSYQEFSIELDYRDKTRTPKYIVITACASKYGDYFTGGVGSTLYVDEFEFVYDPDELSE